MLVRIPINILMKCVVYAPKKEMFAYKDEDKSHLWIAFRKQTSNFLRSMFES